MTHKNMKIKINNEQPLDEVVEELERLGFKKGCWWAGFGEIKAIEADEQTRHLVDYRSTDIDELFGELTNLQQLREMK